MKNLKYIITIFLYAILIGYIIYNNRQISATTFKGFKGFSLDENDKENYIHSLKENCNTDGCLLSISITNLVVELIEKKGLKETVNILKANPKKYQTYKGDYVFIFSPVKEKSLGGMINIYHPNKGLHNTDAITGEKEIHKTCPADKCPYVWNLKKMGDFIKKYKEGINIYSWYDNRTKDMVIKRSYVKRLENVEWKGKKITLMIGSGETILHQENQNDYTSLVIHSLKLFAFLFLWKFLQLSILFSNIPVIKNLIFTVLVFIQFVILYNTKKRDVTLATREKELSRVLTVGGLFAGMTLSISVFFRALLSSGDIEFEFGSEKKILYVFATAFVFSILIINRYPSQNTTQNLLIKSQIKNSLVFLTSFLFCVAIIGIVTNLNSTKN